MPSRKTIRESRDYLKKNSGVRKGCACVAKPIVATIERVTSETSVASDSIKELWKTVEKDPCQGIAYFYPKKAVEEDGIHTKPFHL